MSEEIRENEEMEATSVEIDSDVEDSVDSEESRTNVRESSSGDDELDSYSESVQRRINQLTAKRKQAAEEAQAAVQYAQQMQQENETMKRRLQQMNGAYNNEAENRLKAQEIQATRALQEANEAGDYERVAKAQQALAKIAMAKEKVGAQKAKLVRQQKSRSSSSAAGATATCSTSVSTTTTAPT